MSQEKRRGLGRGLSALLPADEGVRTLPIDQLQPNRHQPRSWFDDSGLDELAASIRAQGVIQPLIVTPSGSGTYAIVAGERRWRAARRAGLKVVPVVVRQVRDDRQLLELALVENLQRADLNPIEEAE
ncbi:MAG: ParB/RepB/Spo0J family partition protein, partial [Acidobacteria bacterium]|nr:ParB/RepB/Spo0J family partition protein [Acidobacteriota bacterium]